MNIELLQADVDKTEYWDMRIFDIQAKYYGDEICVYIENDEKKCWEIKLLSCGKVCYETDAKWRGIDNVKSMRGGQLGYFGQDISIKKNKKNVEFIDITMDFSISTMKVSCKNIEVRECNIEELVFFWRSDK